MRVLMFGWEFPPYLSGGLGTACFDMTRALARKGTRIKFIQPQLKGIGEIALEKGLVLASASGVNISSVIRNETLSSWTDSLWENNLTVHSVDSTLIPYTNPESYYEYMESLYYKSLTKTASDLKETLNNETVELAGGYGKNLMEEVWRYGQAAAAIAAESDFDVIHVHDWMTYPAGMLVKQLTGKPLVVHVHSLERDRSGKNTNGEVSHIEWAGMNAADVVVAVSQYTKNMILQDHNIPEEKIEVVHNAVSRTERGKQYDIPDMIKNEKRVLFLGRITYQKGPEYFVEAAHLVLSKIPGARFIMAGAGDMLPRLIRRVSELRMGNHFHFTGFMNREEIEHAFAMSDLYVMPSVSEPFGITPLEAMASDVPVLISNQSGVAEVLRGALKVDFWDVNEIANKICAVLKYKVLAEQIVKYCREDLESIRWENAAEKLNCIYERLI